MSYFTSSAERDGKVDFVVLCAGKSLESFNRLSSFCQTSFELTL